MRLPKMRFIVTLSAFLLLYSLNILSVLSQEPPTEEPSPIPTETATELPPPTATFTELPPPTATNTEIPSPTATETEMPSLTPTETPAETTIPATETPTETATDTAIPTLTPTLPVTATPSPEPALAPAAQEAFGALSACSGIAVVNAGDVQGLLDAVNAANELTVCTIYLNADIDFNASEELRTYGLTEPLGISGNVTIHGNNAILRQTTSGAVLQIYGDVEMHYVTVAGGLSTGYTGGILNSGILRLIDSTVIQNTASSGGGGIFNSGNLTLNRVAIQQNEAGGGAGIQNEYSGSIDAECVRFWNNEGGYGVGLLNGATFNTNAQINIRYSSFDGNVAEGPDAGADIFNLLPNDVTIVAQHNWWGADEVAEVDDGQTGASIDTSQPEASDPTVPVSGVYPRSECQPADPVEPPQACEVLSNGIFAPVRLQPSLYSENVLFDVPDTYVYDADTTILGTSMPGRDWLWPGGSEPGSITITRIKAIAHVGSIGWVQPNIDWIQVEVTNNAVSGLTGYMERTDFDGNDVLPLFSCNVGILQAPTPDPLPTATLDAFAGVSPIISVFDSLQSPATMGSFGLHLGTNPSQPGATLDIVPRNIELCIDTSSDLSQCDTETLPPVRSPVTGCAIHAGTGTFTVEINVSLYDRDNTCVSNQADGDLQVVITHVDSSLGSGSRVPVTASEIIGFLCDSGTAVSECGVNDTNPPTATHVAFQLRTLHFSGGNVVYEQEQADVLGFLAIPSCLYDEWELSPGDPTTQGDPFHACPA